MDCPVTASINVGGSLSPGLNFTVISSHLLYVCST